MENEKIYTYCSVLPANYNTPYWYISDFEVKIGDLVIIPIRANNNEKVGLVLEVKKCKKQNAPYPVDQTKHIRRPFGQNEPKNLQKEKALLDSEKDVRIRSADQIEKINIKKCLQKNRVNSAEIDESAKKITDIIKNIPGNNRALNSFCLDLLGGIRLSDNGKIVIGFKNNNPKDKAIIRIPSGVESIEDNAFNNVKIAELYIPKELKNLGEYTLINKNKYGDFYPKQIDHIVVEKGNEHFYSDEIGFYSICDDKRRLECLFNKTISTYSFPEDVYSVSEYAFWFCSKLRKVVLSDGFEEFDCSCLPNEIEEVIIPKRLKKLHYFEEHVNNESVSFRIDEENEYIFRDEDSIYEVLEDGTYKLIANLYHGKGKVLILEGTSIIGKMAFKGHTNFSTVEFPRTLRVIEEEAFYSTALESLVVPDYVQRIESHAFEDCEYLRNVQLSQDLEYVESNAFDRCPKLKSIKSEGNKKAFSYKNGIINKLI